jgi:hypothetical protein
MDLVRVNLIRTTRGLLANLSLRERARIQLRRSDANIGFQLWQFLTQVRDA